MKIQIQAMALALQIWARIIKADDLFSALMLSVSVAAAVPVYVQGSQMKCSKSYVWFDCP